MRSTQIVGALVSAGMMLWFVPQTVGVVVQVIYVDDDAAPNGDGTTWITAFDSLQDALQAAEDVNPPPEDRVQIWVARGTYKPDLGAAQTPGDREAAFGLRNNVVVYGGFFGNETDIRDRDFELHVTTLSGDIHGNDSVPCPNGDADCNTLAGACFQGFCVADNSYHVLNSGDVDGTPITFSALLDGFTIRAGRADGPWTNHRNSGGGMHNINSSPQVRDCTFIDNFAEAEGGAVVNRKGSPAIFTNCRFQFNETNGNGGAMFNELISSVRVRDSRFFRNTAGQDGGAIYNVNQSWPDVRNSEFRENVASDNSAKGGAMYVRSPSNDETAVAVLVDCTFIQGRADKGGAVYIEETNVDLINVAFFGNKAVGGSAEGGAAWVDTDPTGFGAPNQLDVNFINCLFSGNTADSLGGGMYHVGELAAYHNNLVNCTFSHNQARGASTEGGGLYTLSGKTDIDNSIFWDNGQACQNCDANGNCDCDQSESGQITVGAAQVQVNYSAVQGGWSGAGSNNIALNPEYVDPQGADLAFGTEDDNLRLKNDPGSPCFESGDSFAVPPDEHDINGNGSTGERLPYDLKGLERVVGVVDMGVYEASCQSDAECDDQVACTINVCDPAFNVCTFIPDPAACDDAQPCTDDICDVVLGCQNVSNPSLCGDGDVCTCNLCVEGFCQNPSMNYGDVDCNGVINIFDLLCIQACFAGSFNTCTFEDCDVQPCLGNGTIDIFDLLAVLGAFGGTDACCTEGACCLDGDVCADLTGQDCATAGGVYQGQDTDCGTFECPGGGAAAQGSGGGEQGAGGSTLDLALVAGESKLSAEGIYEFDVYASGFVDLRGYQIAVDPVGGTTGRLELKDIGIDATRPDYVFTALESYHAVDKTNRRLMCVLASGGVSSKGPVYLGSFAFGPTPDARGTFDLVLRTGDGTLLLDSFGRRIQLRSVTETTISVP